MKETLDKAAREALWRDFLTSVMEAGASVAMHGASGFGMYGVDVLVQTDEAKKALQIIEAADDSGRDYIPSILG